MPSVLTHRQEIVLAGLGANASANYAPVQVQKLFFLVDQKISESIGGKQFAFEAYDYGPFDHNIYRELEALNKLGLVSISPTGTGERRMYSLTPSGQDRATEAMTKLPPVTQEYLIALAKWICSLTFAQLVGSIYKEYPEMRRNSVFND